MQHKIGVYIRVSTEEQATAIEGSLDNQRYRLKDHVDMKNKSNVGWGKIIEFYVDDGYSAKDTNRPAYQKMMTDLRKNKIDLILVADLSRLSRNLYDFCELLKYLDSYKASFLSIKEQFDTSTPIGRMIIYIIMTLAQFEREQTAERVSLGVHARAMRGLMNGGRQILGFNKDPYKPGSYVVNEDEAEIARQIFDIYLEAGSKAKAIEVLDIKGIKPKLHPHYKKQKESGEWSVDHLGHLLRSTAYIGYHEVNKSNKHLPQESLKPSKRHQLVKAPWPAIISEDVFNAVQDRLQMARKVERSRMSNVEERVYILSGLLKCSECGASLIGYTAHGRAEAYRYYAHTHAGSKLGCKVQRVGADKIEEAVVRYLKESITDAGYFQRLRFRIAEYSQKLTSRSVEDILRLRQELKILDTETENIFKLQMHGTFGADALKLISDRLESVASRKVQAIKHLAQLDKNKEECVDAAVSSTYIHDKILDFNSGFRKAAPMLKKRLLSRTIRSVAVGTNLLTIWFYESEEDSIPGHKLKLVRDDEKIGSLLLTSHREPIETKPAVSGSFIGAVGDPTGTRTWIDGLGNLRFIQI